MSATKSETANARMNLTASPLTVASMTTVTLSYDTVKAMVCLKIHYAISRIIVDIDI